MNDDEHVECLNECMFSSVVYVNDLCIYACSSSNHFIQFLCIFMFMGLVSQMFNDTVASPSPVRGLVMLQVCFD